MSTVLSVQNLILDFNIAQKNCHALNGVSLTVNQGEIVAVVGESGCGKTLTASAVMGLIPHGASIAQGSIKINDREITTATQQELSHIRGKNVSMIFQEPMTALNPLMKVGRQIAENAENAENARHSKAKAKEMTLQIMELVGLPDPSRLYNNYPHQLSGGMRQRIMIAMALVNRPQLLIADEPTTALDVTIQAQIMELIAELNHKTGTAVLLITHDLGVVSHMCDRVYVMYAGRVVESGMVADILSQPLHPYTKGLLQSIPDIAKKGMPLHAIPGHVPPLEKRAEQGCLYADRCPHCMEKCLHETPVILQKDRHSVFCHYCEEII